MRSLNPWPTFPSNLEPPVARSLSLQFILQALLNALDLVKGATLKQDFTTILNQLEKVYLFSLENPFAQKGGALDKLCFYSEILIQASHLDHSELVLAMEEMRKSILTMKSKIMMWKKTSTRYSLEIVEHLMELYAHLFEKLRRFFNGLLPFLKEDRLDENVLIYLIENKERFNRHLGSEQIEMILQNLFPEGHDQLRAVIHEGFLRRGFDAFLSSVEPLIDAIQWDPLCCQSTF